MNRMPTDSVRRLKESVTYDVIGMQLAYCDRGLGQVVTSMNYA